MKTVLKISFVVIMTLGQLDLSAQSIVGPNSVYETTTRTYTYTASSWFEHRWEIIKGVSIDESDNGLVFTVVVKWTSAGAGSVKLEEYDVSGGKNESEWVSKTKRNVTVNACPSLSVPNISSVSRCGPGEITLSGTPGTNGSTILWYTSMESTVSYASATSKSYTVSNPTNNYYVTTLSESTGCESAKTMVSAYVNPVPDAPLPLSERQCGTGPIVLNANSGSNGNIVKWYDSPTNTNPFSTNNSFTASGLNSNTAYYITSYNSTTGCESSTRATVYITVDTNLPPMPEVSNFTRCGPGGFNVVASGASNYTWYTPEMELIQTGSSMVINGSISSTINNSMVVKAVNPSGCESPARWVSLVVLPVPQITATSTVIAMGKPVTLVVNGNYDSYSWKNQNNQQVETQQQFVTNTVGVYYVMLAKNGVYTECRSNEIEIIGQTDNLNKNYIITNTMQRKGVNSLESIPNLTNKENQQSITYFDGLGRPQQNIVTQGTTSEHDLIQAIAYDDVQRENKKLLPYVSTEANGRYKKNAISNTGVTSVDELVKYRSGEQYNYYQTGAAGIVDAYPYAHTVFDTSPLNRPLKNYGAGKEWSLSEKNKFIENKYLLNVYDNSNPQHENIICWKLNQDKLVPADNEPRIIDGGGFYSSSQLAIVVTSDEEGNEIREYTDKNGHIVLKRIAVVKSPFLNNDAHWASTYYIYDDLGNLVLVLPPEGVEKLKTALNLN